MHRWKLAAFALVVGAAAVGIILAACFGFHRCCAPQPVVYVTQPAVVVTRVLPTQTPADTATPRTIVIRIDQTVVVTREVQITQTPQPTSAAPLWTPTPTPGQQKGRG